MRNDRANGAHHTTRQKGRSRKGSGVGTYSKKNKSLRADRYDRPYLQGTYNRADLA